MEKIFNFIAQNKDVSFATVNAEGNPAIRVFQVMWVDEGNKSLYFATSAGKEVYKQLLDNPNVEILAYKDNLSVRISGYVVFDVPDALCQKIYNDNEVLPRLYSQYKDLIYFRLVIKKADYYNLTPTPPVLENYTF